MFYFPDKIILALSNQNVAARMNGPSEDCLQRANVPCSIDFKKSAAGQLDSRVRTDAKVIVPGTDDTRALFAVGTQFVVERLKGVFWEVADVDEQEGVFNNAGTLELRCIRKTGQLGVTGASSVEQRLAEMAAKNRRPGAP